MRAALFFVIALFGAGCGAPSDQTPRGQTAAPTSAMLEVRDAWAAPTPGGVEVSAGYLTIVNTTGADDRLTGASSPRAEHVELHEMSMDGGVMRMRPIEGGLTVPAGATTTLASGGRHLMFYGVRQPFAEGQRIPVTLHFAQAGDVAVELPVRRAASEHAGH